MKYLSVNEPNNFSFHDAVINKVRVEDNDMIWTVEAANAEKTNSQNPYDKAMCIDSAEVVFKNFHIDSIVAPEYKTVHNGSEYITPEKILTGSEIKDLIDLILQEEEFGYIYSLNGVKSDDGFTIEIMLCPYREISPFNGMFYDITIACDEFTVGWDNFDGAAWYESDKWKSPFKDAEE